jgi:aminopeptidase N
MQKYFSMQAQRRDADEAIATVRDIMDNEPEFRHEIAHNWYALIGAFSGHYGAFHKSDGSGYELLADAVLKADKINSAIAAKLVTKLADWKKYDAPHGDLMREELKRIASTEGISQNLRANVTKALPLVKTSPNAPKPKI